MVTDTITALEAATLKLKESPLEVLYPEHARPRARTQKAQVGDEEFLFKHVDQLRVLGTMVDGRGRSTVMVQDKLTKGLGRVPKTSEVRNGEKPTHGRTG